MKRHPRTNATEPVTVIVQVVAVDTIASRPDPPLDLVLLKRTDAKPHVAE